MIDRRLLDGTYITDWPVRCRVNEPGQVFASCPICDATIRVETLRQIFDAVQKHRTDNHE
jgi:hypothetical protein